MSGVVNDISQNASCPENAEPRTPLNHPDSGQFMASTLGSLEPEILHLEPEILNTKPSTLNLQPSTLNPQPSTLNPQPSSLNPQPSTLNPRVQVNQRVQGHGGRPREYCQLHVRSRGLYPWGLGLRVQNSGCKVQGRWCGVQETEFGRVCLGFRFHFTRCVVQGVGFLSSLGSLTEAAPRTLSTTFSPPRSLPFLLLYLSRA